MKNIILSCAVVCVSAFACINKTYAQASKYRFGIKAGATLMTLGNANNGNGTSTSYDYRPGFQGGIFEIEPISEKVDFIPQLLFSQKGGNAKETVTIAGVTYSAEAKTQINYLDVPLLFGLKAKPNLTFTLGPQVAFLLSQKTTASASGNGNAATQTITSTDGMRKVIIGGNLGANYAINSDLSINLNYLLDLQHAGTDSGSTERNSGFALSLSYLF